jgi:hypothetical protein
MVKDTLKRIITSTRTHKNWTKIIISFSLTAVILIGLLWFNTPVKAIGVTLVNLPTSMTTGNNYSFTAKVTIDPNENIPIDSLRLDLTGPTSPTPSVLFNTDGSIISKTDQFVSIAKQGTSTYTQGSLYGYGYGYSSGSNTLNSVVSAPANDVDVWNNGSNWVWDNGDHDLGAGNYASSLQQWGNGLRFNSINIPQGATITKAYLTFTARYDAPGSVAKTMITGDKEPNAATFSNLADFQSRRGKEVGGADNTKITTAQVPWDFDSTQKWNLGDTYTSPDISTVVQEIINQPNWSSGNNLALFWDDFAGKSDPGAWRSGFSYEGSMFAYSSDIDSPVLTIEYGSVGSGTYKTSWGYGYGYTGQTTLEYLVTINTGTMQSGNYNAQMSVNVPQPVDSSVTKFLSVNYPFSITAASSGGGASPTINTLVLNGLTGNSVTVDNNGVTTVSSQLTSTNGSVILNIASGTKLLDSQGHPLTMLSAASTSNLPAPPVGSVIISSVEFGPTGATFNPAINVSFKYNAASLPTGVLEPSLYIAYWNGSVWQQLVGTVDTKNDLVTASVTHFTSFALIGAQTPVTTTPVATTSTTTTQTTTTKTTSTTTPITTKTTTPTSSTTTNPVSTTTLTTNTTTSTVSTTTASKAVLPWWSWVLIGVAVFIIAIIAVIMVRRNK